MSKEVKEGMQAALDHLKEELGSLRTGKANPAMLDSIFVEVYGAQMALRDVATTTAPEPRQLLVSPFDAQNAAAIAKAIERSDLGLNGVVDGNVVRITVPEMSQEVRDQMRKLCSKKGEEAKVSIRNVRRAAINNARKEKDAGTLTEDDEKRLEKEVQKLTDSFCEKVDEMTKEKDRDIATI